MRSHHVIAAAVAMSLPIMNAGAQVLDFEHLRVENGEVNFVGRVVTEDGFQITEYYLNWYEFAVFGTQEPRYPGSTALFNGSFHGLTKISSVNGSAFDVYSIDFALLNGPGTVQIDLVGTPADGGAPILQTITHMDEEMPLDLITCQLDGFVNLSSIEWTQESPYHQFDNVVISQSHYGLSVRGQCPGALTVSWSGATPSRQQGIVFGNSTGSTMIPNGACAGTQLGIQGGVQLVNTIGTGSGGGSVNGNAGTFACGHYLQLVEAGSCNTSNVAQIP